MCSSVQSLPPLKAYIPSGAEIKTKLYELFSTFIATSMIFNAARGILSAGGFLLGFAAQKSVDYLTDAFLQGVLSEDKINLIKTLIKVVGIVLSVIASVFLFGYPLEALLVMLGIYLIFNVMFKWVDPLELPGSCLRAAIQ